MQYYSIKIMGKCNLEKTENERMLCTLNKDFLLFYIFLYYYLSINLQIFRKSLSCSSTMVLVKMSCMIYLLHAQQVIIRRSTLSLTSSLRFFNRRHVFHNFLTAQDFFDNKMTQKSEMYQSTTK